MTTVYAYDAMGVGLSTKSGTFVSSGTTDIVTYTDSVWYDYDTIEVYEEYNYGQYYVYSYVDFVGGTTYAVQDMYAYDQFNNDLLDVIGLNLQFNILDDFSGDILFSNIWSGNDHMTGNNYGDAIYLGAGQDTGIGRGGNDRIYGESGNDYLYGDAHNDYLHGGTGNDRLFGGLGNDTLVASTGRDVLVGGLGRDVLAGGTDSLGDVFDFNAKSESLVGANRDLIQNFTRSFDDIDLSGIDARATTTTFNDAFRYAGNVASPYAVWWMTYNGGVLVRADVSGDRVADLEIQVTGTTTLSSIDFIL